MSLLFSGRGFGADVNVRSDWALADFIAVNAGHVAKSVSQILHAAAGNVDAVRIHGAVGAKLDIAAGELRHNVNITGSFGDGGFDNLFGNGAQTCAGADLEFGFRRFSGKL